MKTVLLVEDDVATRDWLAAMLQDVEGTALAFSCGGVREAIAWLHAGHSPDIVLTDLGLPDGSGIEIIQEAAKLPGCEILVLSIFGDEHNVLSAIDAGAGGYLLKDGSLDSIRDHLNCLSSGGSPLSPRIARTLIRRARSSNSASATVVKALNNEANSEHGPLSGREYDVLVGISKGYSYTEVATALGISTNTVRTHVRKIFSKLAVNSSIEALFEYNRLMDASQLPRLG